MREYRRKQKAATAVTAPATVNHADPVSALVDWSREKLIVPPGHPLAGQPMTLPAFATDFLRSGWDSHESALTCGRKNAKSAILGVLGLGFLVGPLRRPGFPHGKSPACQKRKRRNYGNKFNKSGEASKLRELRYRKSPYPGKIESATGSIEVLSSDRSAGHSSSFDLVVVDETGLFPERSRETAGGPAVQRISEGRAHHPYFRPGG